MNMNRFRSFIINVFTTTGLTLVILSSIAAAFGGSVLFVETIFQSLFANLLIHAGLILVNKLESRYFLLEYLYRVMYVLLVLIPCGYAYGWYSSTPLWMVILMGIGIYVIGSLIDVMQVQSQVQQINDQLKRRKQNKE